MSIDKTALIIIWEIQNNYFAKYIIKNENQNDIDSSLFFNILNKDYIIVSNESKDIFSKIYEFKKDTPFVKDIFGTKENDIKFTIPWEYKDNFYIIEFCDELKISINNLFKNEIYAILFYKDERINSEYNNCFIYNKNYLLSNMMNL